MGLIMYKIFVWISFITITTACNENHLEKRTIGNEIAESNFMNDSLMNGQAIQHIFCAPSCLRAFMAISHKGLLFSFE
jgi:hypothetical protein